MGVEENKEVVRRIFEEAWNKKDMTILDERLSPDYVFHRPTGDKVIGLETYKQFMTIAYKQLPDIHFTIETIVAEEDIISCWCTYTSSYVSEEGVTGKTVNLSDAYFHRFEDGILVETRVFADTLQFCKQLGIDPTTFK